MELTNNTTSSTPKERLAKISTACADALAAAYSSLLVAKDMAHLGDLPLINRVEELSDAVYSLSSDSKKIAAEVQNSLNNPAEELPTFEAELSPLERDLLDRMRTFGMPMRIERGGLGWGPARVLAARGLIHSLPTDSEMFTVTKYLPIGKDKALVPVNDGLYRLYQHAMSGGDVVITPGRPHSDSTRKAAQKLVDAGVLAQFSENIYRAVPQADPTPDEARDMLKTLNALETLIVQFVHERSQVEPTTQQERAACENMVNKRILFKQSSGLFALTDVYKAVLQ
jgi:hypothetical protein